MSKFYKWVPIDVDGKITVVVELLIEPYSNIMIQIGDVRFKENDDKFEFDWRIVYKPDDIVISDSDKESLHTYVGDVINHRCEELSKGEENHEQGSTISDESTGHT